jgi:hypothetical protein
MSVATITDLWRMSATELAERSDPATYQVGTLSRRICAASKR